MPDAVSRDLVRRALMGLAVVGVLSVLALAVVVGDHRFQGPVVLPLTWSHGLHLGDGLVGLAWLLCVGMVARLVVAPAASR
ncbi:hypothetical protein [Quadrisphaera setariae]|uniref:Uncharacterized protein n=1 Tax=Quadrisphaera setariae TaxID=2593304 RepID=A0A5C8ZGN6_9ACTN|nr:hypothetical protein [Quadrisphaera setariae]TXR56388.1 hypothetical protein FMM08_09820 [Quadrisphaera setariae]